MLSYAYVVLHLMVVYGIIRDARRAGNRPWLALAVLALVPSPVNLIVYLYGRSGGGALSP